MADRKLYVDVVMDDTKAQAGLKRLEATGTQSAGSIAKGFVGAQLALSALNKIWSASVDFAKQSINLANDTAETNSKINAIFKESTAEIQAWGQTTSAAITQTSVAAQEQAANFFAMTQNLGIAKDEAFKMSTALTELASDLGSFMNADPSEVVVALSAAMRGSFEPIQKYNVFLDAETIKQQAVAMGLATTTQEVTKAHKAQATYNLIMQQTVDAQGDVTRTQDSMANLQKRLNAQMDTAKMTIGQVVSENETLKFAMGKVVEIIEDTITRISEWIKNNKALVEQITKNVIVALSYFGEGVAFVAGEIGKMIIAVGSLNKIFGVMEAVQNRNWIEAGNLALQLGGVGGAMAGVDETTAGFIADMGSLRDQVHDFTFVDVPPVNSGLGEMEDRSYGAAEGTGELKKQMGKAREEAQKYSEWIDKLNEGLGKLGSPANRIGVRQAIRTAIGAGNTAQEALLAGAADLVEEQARKDEENRRAEGGGGYYSPSGSFSAGAEAYSSITTTEARRGLPLAGGPSYMISGYRGMYGAMFESPFHGTLFPNAQGSIAARGTSEANPIIVKVVGDSINLAEAIV